MDTVNQQTKTRTTNVYPQKDFHFSAAQGPRIQELQSYPGLHTNARPLLSRGKQAHWKGSLPSHTSSQHSLLQSATYREGIKAFESVPG